VLRFDDTRQWQSFETNGNLLAVQKSRISCSDLWIISNSIGIRVQIPSLRGKNSHIERRSSTELLPDDSSPRTTICGNTSLSVDKQLRCLILSSVWMSAPALADKASKIDAGTELLTVFGATPRFCCPELVVEDVSDIVREENGRQKDAYRSGTGQRLSCVSPANRDEQFQRAGVGFILR